MSCCRATSSMIALCFKRSQRKMSYHPCPGEVLSRNDAGQHIVGDGGVFNSPTQILQRTKVSGIEKEQPRKPFRFKSAPPDFMQ